MPQARAKQKAGDKPKTTKLAKPPASSQALVASKAPGEFVYNFGKHKNKSFSEVMEFDPGYAPHLIKSNAHHTRPDFKQAVVDAGLLSAEESAQKPPPGQLALLPSGNELEQQVDSKKRKSSSKQTVQAKNCLICGAQDHNARTCPQRNFSEGFAGRAFSTISPLE